MLAQEIPPSAGELLLDLRGIVRRFSLGSAGELTVLPGLDFFLQRGEFVSIVGASGSGKSTFMNIVGMLDRPTEGSYFFSGRNVLEMDDDELSTYRARNIGFIFQNFNLIGRMTAVKNVEVAMIYAGVPRNERTERAMHLLEQVDMAGRAHHTPGELSGGQKQRVAIARSLANNPELLLADEPTGALDTASGRMVMDVFHRLHEEGRSIMFITHNPELAAETNRTAVLVDGRIQ